MRDADAKVEESNMSRISMQKSAKIMQKIRIENLKKCKHAMVRNKYEITTGLPIDKGS